MIYSSVLFKATLTRRECVMHVIEKCKVVNYLHTKVSATCVKISKRRDFFFSGLNIKVTISLPCNVNVYTVDSFSSIEIDRLYGRFKALGFCFLPA